MKDLIQEGRKIQETFKSSMNEVSNDSVISKLKSFKTKYEKYLSDIGKIAETDPYYWNKSVDKYFQPMSKEVDRYLKGIKFSMKGYSTSVGNKAPSEMRYSHSTITPKEFNVVFQYPGKTGVATQQNGMSIDDFMKGINLGAIEIK